MVGVLLQYAVHEKCTPMSFSGSNSTRRRCRLKASQAEVMRCTTTCHVRVTARQLRRGAHWPCCANDVRAAYDGGTLQHTPLLQHARQSGCALLMPRRSVPSPLRHSSSPVVFSRGLCSSSLLLTEVRGEPRCTALTTTGRPST